MTFVSYFPVFVNCNSNKMNADLLTKAQFCLLNPFHFSLTTFSEFLADARLLLESQKLRHFFLFSKWKSGNFFSRLNVGIFIYFEVRNFTVVVVVGSVSRPSLCDVLCVINFTILVFAFNSIVLFLPHSIANTHTHTSRCLIASLPKLIMYRRRFGSKVCEIMMPQHTLLHSNFMSAHASICNGMFWSVHCAKRPNSSMFVVR